MIRVVIDTNSLVAALVKPAGSSARLLELWRADELELVGSNETLREARLVISGRWLERLASKEAVESLIAELEAHTIIVAAPVLPELTLKDEGDRRLVEAAAAGAADYLVTADREVLLMRGYGPTEFLGVSQLLSRLRA